MQQHVRTFYDGFTAQGLAPNEFFTLPRSSWAGLSRYSSGGWPSSRQWVALLYSRRVTLSTVSLVPCVPPPPHSL